MRSTKDWIGQKLEMRLKKRSEYLGSPSAGQGVLRQYKNFLKIVIGRKKHFKALVLGATPELCDLVIGNDGELTLCDASLEAILKSEKVMRFNLDEAIIVKSNWLKCPLADSYYDIVLGDLVFLNISLKQQLFLAKEIMSLLKKDGYFITRNIIQDKIKRYYQIEEIDSNFRNNKIHWFDAFMDLLFCSSLTKKCLHGSVIYLDKFQRELDKIYHSGLITSRLYFELKKFQPVGTRTVLEKNKFEETLEKYFKLLPVKQARDFKYTQDTMIFFFGRVRK